MVNLLRMRVMVAACCGAVILGAAMPALGDVVTIGASQDVTLFGGSDATTNNTSSGPALYVGSDGSSPKRAIIAFDVADNLPADAVITGATLTLYLGAVAGAGGGGSSGTGGDSTARTIRLYDVTTAWNPSSNGTTGVTGFGGTGHGSPANAGDATWNDAMYSTTAWTTPGGDYSGTQSAESLISENLNTGYMWSSAQMAADVQGWLEDPSSNDGWILINDTEAGTTKSFRAFYSKEGAAELDVASEAPSLTITYTTATPEPLSVALLVGGAGLLALGRRGRRRNGRG